MFGCCQWAGMQWNDAEGKLDMEALGVAKFEARKFCLEHGKSEAGANKRIENMELCSCKCHNKGSTVFC